MPKKDSIWNIQDTFLNKIRMRRNLTIRELSNILEIPTSTVGKWCSGISVPTTKNIIKLADILNVEYDYLLEHCREDNENYKKHAKGAKKQTHNEKVELNNEIEEEKPSIMYKTPKYVLIEIRFETDEDIKYNEIYDNIFDFVKSNFDNSDCLRVDLDIDGYTLHNYGGKVVPDTLHG